MTWKSISVSLVASLLLIMLLTACSSGKPNVPPIAPEVTTIKEPSVSLSPIAWQSDGIIAENEYSRSQKIGEIDVFSRLEGDSVMFALKAKTTGWLSLGIDQESKMQNADILMCYVKDGKGIVVDMFSTGMFGPHPPDDKQGGTSNVTMISGSENDGVIIIEFKRKLDTVDTMDKPLKLGENKVIWAIGDSKEISMKHNRRGYGILTL